MKDLRCLKDWHVLLASHVALAVLRIPRTVIVVHHMHKHCACFPPVVRLREVAGIVAGVVTGIEGHHIEGDRTARRLDRAGGSEVDIESLRQTRGQACQKPSRAARHGGRMG